MRKTLQTIITLLVCAAVMTACTKTEDTANEAVRQGEATIGRIMDFKRQMEEAKANPGMKSTSYMSMTDAVWNVEALFNLTYAYPELAYSKTVDCDTTLYLPVSSNDSVSINDLTVFYGQMFNAVQAIYQSVDLDDKQFLILDVEAGERHGSQQAIRLNAMQGSVSGAPDLSQNPRENPFPDGVLWFYGQDGGNNDTINPLGAGTLDAADTLARTLNANLVPVAPEGYQYYYTDIKKKELADGVQWPYIYSPNQNQVIYCEFYKVNPVWDDDYWLSSDQMNLYYNGECHLVQNVLPNYSTNTVPATHSLFRVTIEDMERQGSPHAILHHTKARYGHRETLAQGDMPGKDPLEE
ncbi:MAG: hypothetical protein K6A94_13800 [Bacteroidales bacterium]|nr:hypothetical protein [Bacteroidales bacterium]